MEDFNLFLDNFLLKKGVLQPIIGACTGMYVIIVFISWLQERCGLHEKLNVPKGNARKVLGGHAAACERKTGFEDSDVDKGTE